MKRFRQFWRGTFRRWWYDYEWPVIGTLALAVLVLGCIGFREQLLADKKPIYLLDLIFRSCQLFVLMISVDPPMPWQLNAARMLAPLVAAYTALQALTELFAGQMQSLRLRRSCDHVVICGLGRKGYILARRFLEGSQRLVIVERDEDNAYLPQCRAEGALVVIGDAAEVDVLNRAGVPRARCVIAVCGDDGANAQVAVVLREHHARRRLRRLTCIVHIADPDLYQLIRAHELAADLEGGFRLEFFNIVVNGARAFFNEFPLFNRAVAPDGVPHLLVVGDGLMTEALVVEAAQNWQPRFLERKERLAVTVTASAAARHTAAWQVKHPSLTTACDLRAVDMDLDSAEFQRGAFTRGATMVVVCMDDDDRRGISIAMAQHRRLQDQPAPVVAWLVEQEGLPSLLSPVESGGADTGGGLHFFGLLDHTCSPGLLPDGIHELLARILHHNYLVAERAKGRQTGDAPNRQPWEKLPEEFRESSRLEADFIWVKLQAIGCTVEPLSDRETALKFQFTPAELETLARLEHERWRSERLQSGWNHGPSRDNDLKLNPLLLAWTELPDAPREENRRTALELPAVLARADFQIRRRIVSANCAS